MLIAAAKKKWKNLGPGILFILKNIRFENLMWLLLVQRTLFKEVSLFFSYMEQFLALPYHVTLLQSYWMLSSTFPLIFKETFQHVNLNSWYHHHYSQVDHGPEIHSVKVAFLYISVTSFKCSEQGLDLDAFAQSGFDTVDGFLVTKE